MDSLSLLSRLSSTSNSSNTLVCSLYPSVQTGELMDRVLHPRTAIPAQYVLLMVEIGLSSLSTRRRPGRY
jgi:hypothetical protein